MGVPIMPNEIAPGFMYQHHPHHRNGIHGKSQWRIPELDERNAFDQARNRNWLTDACGWGLHTPNGIVSYLGVDQDHGRQLFVAKFIVSDAPAVWHGYPADHQRNPQDIPDNDVLRDWMRSRILTDAKVRKLMRGQPCNL
jgi:hypothetical protein